MTSNNREIIETTCAQRLWFPQEIADFIKSCEDLIAQDMHKHKWIDAISARMDAFEVNAGIADHEVRSRRMFERHEEDDRQSIASRLKSEGIDVHALVAERAALRAQGAFDAADKIRDVLASAGITVSDTQTGASWRWSPV